MNNNNEQTTMTSQVSKEEKSKQGKKSRALELRQRARAEGLPRKPLVEGIDYEAVEFDNSTVKQFCAIQFEPDQVETCFVLIQHGNTLESAEGIDPKALKARGYNYQNGELTFLGQPITAFNVLQSEDSEDDSCSECDSNEEPLPNEQVIKYDVANLSNPTKEGNNWLLEVAWCAVWHPVEALAQNKIYQKPFMQFYKENKDSLHLDRYQQMVDAYNVLCIGNETLNVLPEKDTFKSQFPVQSQALCSYEPSLSVDCQSNVLTTKTMISTSIQPLEVQSNPMMLPNLLPPMHQSSFNQVVPLAINRTRYIGPVVRISKPSHISTCDGSTESAHRTKRKFPPYNYSIVNRELHLGSRSICLDQHPSTVSTYVMREQTNTTSMGANWCCHFCKKRSHENRLGDLHGPYVEECTIKQPSAPLTPKLIEGSSSIETVACNNEGELYLKPIPPMSPASPASPASNAPNLEHWFHEDCLIWTPNIIADSQGRLLDCAQIFKSSQQMLCISCHRPGATLACYDQSCYFRALHFPCARAIGCFFDESKLSLFCPSHYQLLQ